jgi:hypothetical protein
LFACYYLSFKTQTNKLPKRKNSISSNKIRRYGRRRRRRRRRREEEARQKTKQNEQVGEEKEKKNYDGMRGKSGSILDADWEVSWVFMKMIQLEKKNVTRFGNLLFSGGFLVLHDNLLSSQRQHKVNSLIN